MNACALAIFTERAAILPVSYLYKIKRYLIDQWGHILTSNFVSAIIYKHVLRALFCSLMVYHVNRYVS